MALLILLLGSWLIVRASSAPAPAVTLASSVHSGQPVDTTVTWTATARGLKTPVYAFSVRAPDGSVHTVRDYSPVPSFKWTPMHEGTYTIQTAVKDGFSSGALARASSTFAVTSRATGTKAVVSATANPLVALYSVPPCTADSMGVVVQFRAVNGSAWQSTAPHQCLPGQSVNVLVAGMRPQTRYLLRHVETMGAKAVTSAPLSFTTGKPPVGLKIATFTVKQPATAQADPATHLLFHALNVSPSPALANPIATDRNGELLWYYNTLQSGLTMVWPVHVIADGDVLLFGRDRYRTTGDNVLREVDLAGNVVRETNIDAVNAQLVRRGQLTVYSFHHDALRLPDGDTAVLGSTMKKVGGHNVVGDMILVLDPNFQIVWTWDIFKHLTPPAKYIASEACSITLPMTLCAVPDPKAEDWTHANGLGWSSTDNDLTLSIRHLDEVVKIDYRNGQGTGNIVWRLGKSGDFTMKSTAPSPWFSHQHNAYLATPDTMVLFDNGNTRCVGPAATVTKNCHSRGQELKLDYKAHTVTPVINVDLGTFWQALGSAQLLTNGNASFAGGYPSAHATEVRPDGTFVYELTSVLPEYRVYWMKSLYQSAGVS